jgi:acylphosphatase
MASNKAYQKANYPGERSMDENKQSLSRLHATIEGRVQGVGYRAFVEQNAYSLRLTGWVRNRWDGSVEVLAEGERDDLERLLAALYRGPRASNVSNLRLEWHPATGEFSRFSVHMTG